MKGFQTAFESDPDWYLRPEILAKDKNGSAHCKMSSLDPLKLTQTDHFDRDLLLK